MSKELTRNLNKLTEIGKLVLKVEDYKLTFSNAFLKNISDLLYKLDFQPEIVGQSFLLWDNPLSKDNITV